MWNEDWYLEHVMHEKLMEQVVLDNWEERVKNVLHVYQPDGSNCFVICILAVVITLVFKGVWQNGVISLVKLDSLLTAVHYVSGSGIFIPTITTIHFQKKSYFTIKVPRALQCLPLDRN